MARVKIDLPEKFSFTTSLSVRITDLNYGNHVGNDSILSFLHEARVRYLASLGYSELEFENVSLIMADAALVYKSELIYGDVLLISIQAEEFSRAGFDLIYKVEKQNTEKTSIVVIAKTAMICFDYSTKKIMQLPDEAKNKLSR